MYNLEYLSPTSFMTWAEDPDEFYLKYLASLKVPKQPQTPAMAIGSAFDARIKSFLARYLFGEGARPELDFDYLFQEQVEPQNRDIVLEPSAYLLKTYQDSGTLTDLFLDLKGSDPEPRFESTVKGVVEGVPLLGKPDIYFNVNKNNVIFDWKVNGYYSKSAPSPAPHYIMIRGANASNAPYKDTFVKDGRYQDAVYLEKIDQKWATQTAIYGWLVGEPVGSQFLCAIDQLVCNANKPVNGYPSVRVAQQRAFISSDFQINLLAGLKALWSGIVAGDLYSDEDVDRLEAFTLLDPDIQYILRKKKYY